MGTHLRYMRRSDFLPATAIELASYARPISPAVHEALQRQRNTLGMVAELDGRVVGQMLYTIPPGRIVVLTLAVEPNFRHRDVGSAMLWHLVNKLHPERRTSLELLVPESSRAGRAWLAKRGLLATEIVPAPKSMRREPLIRMAARVNVESQQ